MVKRRTPEREVGGGGGGGTGTLRLNTKEIIINCGNLFRESGKQHKVINWATTKGLPLFQCTCMVVANLGGGGVYGDVPVMLT